MDFTKFHEISHASGSAFLSAFAMAAGPLIAHCGGHVGVGIACDLDAGVPQRDACQLQVPRLLQQNRCVAVAQIVEPHARVNP